MLNLQQNRKNALDKIPQNVCKLLIKFLLSDVFNLQKGYFFHFYLTDLVNTETTIPSGLVNSARCIPRRFTSLYIYNSTTIHLPFGG